VDLVALALGVHHEQAATDVFAVGQDAPALLFQGAGEGQLGFEVQLLDLTRGGRGNLGHQDLAAGPVEGVVLQLVGVLGLGGGHRHHGASPDGVLRLQDQVVVTFF
jgi:hypothetical protein